MRFFKKHWSNLLLCMVFLIGAVMIAYPTVSDLYNRWIHDRAVSNYTQYVNTLDSSAYDEIISSAEDYNKRIAEMGLRWFMTPKEEEEYNEQLSLTESGGIGFLEIPRIDQRLIIYHGIEDEVLEQGVGHFPGTSLPVGGETSHCLLSGHRGLPSAKLFTDLDQLVVGDLFIITVLDRTMTYEVDNIWIVNPNDFSKTILEPGKDLVTLITCTPYGVNSHRLMVRGHRVANISGEANVIAEANVIESYLVMFYITVPLLVVIFAVILFSSSRKRRYRRLLQLIRIQDQEQ